MLRNILKKRFVKSQNSDTINLVKGCQKASISQEYQSACEFKDNLQRLRISTNYVDEYWNAVCNDLLKIYGSESAFSKFGQNEIIINTMIGDPVRNMYSKFRDIIDFQTEEDLLEEWFGNFRLNVPKFNTTGQRLGHIYIARIIESILKEENEEVVTVNEVGGGFGGLSRTLEKRIQAEVYTIIDLWQVLPLQRAYLNLTSNTKSTKYEFVPVQDNFRTQDANVFISNWALTESTMKMQQYVVDSQFFGAKHVFIACQNDNKNHQHGKYLHNYLRSNAKLKLDLRGPMSDSKLFYLRM